MSLLPYPPVDDLSCLVFMTLRPRSKIGKTLLPSIAHFFIRTVLLNNMNCQLHSFEPLPILPSCDTHLSVPLHFRYFSILDNILQDLHEPTFP